MRNLRSHGRLMGALALVFALVLALASGVACQGKTETPPLRIYCAASFVDVASEVARTLEGEAFMIVPGPSNALATQLVDGAPGDLFFCADSAWVDQLEESARPIAERKPIASNRLVCAAAQGSSMALKAPHNPEALAQELAAGERVAVGAEGVPVGDLVRQSLAATGVERLLEPHFVGLVDARAVLRAVEDEQVRAGFMYRTDAIAGAVTELFALDPNTHAKAEIVGVVLSGGSNPERAQAFLDALAAPWAREILSQKGYQTP